MGQHDGVAVIVKAMKFWASSGGVQCNGCLAIVSLVRAESDVCQVGVPCNKAASHSHCAAVPVSWSVWNGFPGVRFAAWQKLHALRLPRGTDRYCALGPGVLCGSLPHRHS